MLKNYFNHVTFFGSILIEILKKFNKNIRIFNFFDN